MSFAFKSVGVVLGVLGLVSGAMASGVGLNVPEPGSLALVGVAVAGLIFVARRGKK